MGRPKGMVKTGGRQKGTPNKATGIVADLLKQNDFDPILNLIKKYPTLSVSEQIKIDLKFIDFLYPKPRITEEYEDRRKFGSTVDDEIDQMSASEIETQRDYFMTRLMIKKEGYAQRVFNILKSTRPDLFKSIKEI